ncbi:MAG: FHA domain-containing protein, partial [Polyangiaceae bacterium]|nr:FHA domain-containing protein [Polyangiaceae bacterium]
MLRLSVVRGVDAGTLLSSEEDLVRIGRGEASELRLTAPHVSADHASIAFTGDGYVLRDHCSTNGTRVLRAGSVFELSELPGRELHLETGDCIELGERSGAEVLEVAIDEPEGSGIVSVRPLAELDTVVEKVGGDSAVLRLLYDSQRAISAANDLDDVIDAVSREVFRLIDRATHVTLALRDEEDAAKGRRSAR